MNNKISKANFSLMQHLIVLVLILSPGLAQPNINSHNTIKRSFKNTTLYSFGYSKQVSFNGINRHLRQIGTSAIEYSFKVDNQPIILALPNICEVNPTIPGCRKESGASKDEIENNTSKPKDTVIKNSNKIGDDCFDSGSVSSKTDSNTVNNEEVSIENLSRIKHSFDTDKTKVDRLCFDRIKLYYCNNKDRKYIHPQRKRCL